MPDLSDYAHLMLGTANTSSTHAELEVETDPTVRTKQGKERARGVPIVGAGSLGGVIEGTDPLAAVLDKAEREGW